MKTCVFFTWLFICRCLGQTPGYAGKPDGLVTTNSTDKTHFSCHLGPDNCVGGGTGAADTKKGYLHAGGNVTVTIIEMKNLPNMDGFGAAGLVTDPYVKLSVQNTVIPTIDTRVSGVIDNNLNPKWPPCKEKYCSGPDDIVRDMNFGNRRAGTLITMDVIDSDSGLEFGDDHMFRKNLYVIYCSAFTAIKQPTPNEAGDGYWEMPIQPVCVEEKWIPLLEDEKAQCFNRDGTPTLTPCAKIRMTVIPFQLYVEEVYLKGAVVNGGMGGIYNEYTPLQYGRVYSGSNDRLYEYPDFFDSRGGMLVRFDSLTKNDKGNTTLLAHGHRFVPYARFSINFDADMYVFRRKEDMKQERQIPEWLRDLNEWSIPKVEKALLAGEVDPFLCRKKIVRAHPRNRYGDSLGGGVITGMNIPQDYNDIAYGMYFVILVPHESYDIEVKVYKKTFNAQAFFISALKFGLVYAIFCYLSYKYLKFANWRLSRCEAFLLQYASSVEEEDDPEAVAKKGILNALFRCYNDSPQNLEFRRNLYYAKIAVNLCLTIPFVVLFTWGCSIVSTVEPRTIGIMLMFLGFAAKFAVFGLVRWQKMGWRMTPTSLTLFYVAFLLSFVFLIASTFTDPAVYNDNAKIDFLAHSSVFLTMNMMPMIWLAFTNDKKIMKSLKQVLAVVTAAQKVTKLKSKFKKLGALGLKLGMAKGKVQRERGEKPKSAFHALMGDHYSVVSTIPGFELADILQNSFVTSSEAKHKKTNRMLYSLALFILVVFAFISWGWSAYPNQGVGIMFTVVLIDLCMAMLLRGNVTWSAGYIVLIMSVSRTCLVLTAGKYWLMGQSMLYLFFGICLCREIVGKNLPRMSKQEAGGITFFGHDVDRSPSRDISTTPEFVLGFLSFFFIFMLLGVVFGQTDPSQFVLLPVFGQEWRMWVFGMVAFIVVLFYGLALATSRGFFLMKQQLLSEYASELFLYFRAFKLPFILAAAAELLVFCAGLFLFAATGSVFIFELCIFGPLIMMFGMVVYSQWIKNDYRLVIWPPPEDEEEEEDDEEFDEQAEYEKEAEAIRDAFVLPPLAGGPAEEDDSTKFRMPALPLKGALDKLKAPTGLPSTKSILQMAGSKKDDKEAKEEEKKDEGEKKEDENKEGEKKEEKEVDPVSLESNTPPGKKSFIGKLRVWTSKNAPWNKYKQVAEKEPQENAKDGEKKEEEEPEVDFNSMSIYQAFWQRYLLPEDYVALASLGMLLLLIFIFGMLVSYTEKPAWLGNLIWVGAFVLLFTLSPLIKYFNVLTVTTDMRLSAGFGYLVAWIAGFILFFQVMKGSVNDVESLIILSFLVLYPIALLLFATIYVWRDAGWQITQFVQISLPVCIFFTMVWIFEMFTWGSVALGGVLTFCFLTFLTVLFFLTKWIENEFYLSPQHQKYAFMILLGTSSFFFGFGIFAGESFFGFSMGLIVIIVKLCANIVGIQMTREPELEIFYSPYIVPVYSYDAKTNTVLNENSLVQNIYTLFAVVFFWGVNAVLFANPLGFGIGLCSLVLLAMAGTSAHLCSITPVKMGIAAKYVNDQMMQEAAEAAKLAFEKRREDLDLICIEFVEKEKREREAELEFQRVSLGKFNQKALQKDEDEDEVKVKEERKCAADLSLLLDDNRWKCKYIWQEDHDERRLDGLFTTRDAFYDCFRGGNGPFAFVSLFGYVYLLWIKLGNLIDETKSRYTMKGVLQNHNLLAQEQGLIDSIKYLKELPAIDLKLDYEFYEETRCIIHFQLLLLNTAEARLARETVLFQKFIRENRFKLMSNGIIPPSNIFKTSSFASIDIPLVAVWLISLTPEERERFHHLKAAFNEEMDRKDVIIDTEDEQTAAAQEDQLAFLKSREDVMCRRRYQEFQARRLRRAEEEIDIGSKDEALANAEEAINEIESGWSCNPGQFGRNLQFIDPDFLPEYSSIAGCAKESEILEWKVSTGININAGLFDGGTDPDDVHQGKLNDAWFLSAISIVAASDGVDDGKVDALIDNMFITKQTSLTGAYAIRFYKNSQWETVIVDDYFPCLDSSYKTEDCAGAAFAYSKNFEELWVPLLEKAYAKYHGGYATIEHGYVHHALKDLTGAKSEQIFLAQASRGSNKKKLWKQMLEFKKNKFLMGAGTITSDNADREILDTGLVFGACYVIYDIRTIDGFALVKLRNPPGDHDEWRGDWSDDSPLWTRRLKKRLGWTDEDDNTFWMSFDDFCNAFRCLFVCRYYDPERWMSYSFNGKWDENKESAGGLPTRHNKGCILENNAQYVLSILRPTDVVITVTQVDETGLAAQVVHPFAIYIVKCSKADRATRIKTLSSENVEACSGIPRCERQIQMYCTLKARTYTVLVAPYVSGMEGPFKIEIRSNFKLIFNQLWPAPWREPKEPTTMAEKMAAKMKEKVAESGAMSKLNEKKNKYKNKIAAGASALDKAMTDDAEAIKEQLNEEEKEQEKKAAGGKKKNPWLEQWDENSGKPYYYNKKTGISSWDKPPDYDDYD